jgi:hypothetical protein
VARAGAPFQLVGIGIELVGNAAKLAGKIGVAAGDAAQFDRGHPHKGDRAPYRSAQTVVVGRHAKMSPQDHRRGRFRRPNLSVCTVPYNMRSLGRARQLVFSRPVVPVRSALASGPGQ